MDEFEWDEAKRLANLEKHRIDFRDAINLFDGRPTITVEARTDVERRFVTIGFVLGNFHTVVWTWRKLRRRIISARRARDEEERRYRELHP